MGRRTEASICWHLGEGGLRCHLVQGHRGWHGTAGSIWPNLEPLQERARVAAEIAEEQKRVREPNRLDELRQAIEVSALASWEAVRPRTPAELAAAHAELIARIAEKLAEPRRRERVELELRIGEVAWELSVEAPRQREKLLAAEREAEAERRRECAWWGAWEHPYGHEILPLRVPWVD